MNPGLPTGQAEEVAGGADGEVHAHPPENSASGPKTSRRTPECSPSAPTTRSNMRGAASANSTATPSPRSSTAVMLSPKTYSTSGVAAWISSTRSSRRISMSALPITPPVAVFSVSRVISLRRRRRPTCRGSRWRATGHRPAGPSGRARECGTADVDRLPTRSQRGCRSTTVTAWPLRCSQYATAVPATLAPDTSTSAI